MDREQSGIHGLVLRLRVGEFNLRAALRARAGRHILMRASPIRDQVCVVHGRDYDFILVRVIIKMEKRQDLHNDTEVVERMY